MDARITDQRGPVRNNSRPSQTRLSISNRAEMLAEHASGASVRELAAQFNVHRGTVREIARQADWQRIARNCSTRSDKTPLSSMRVG